MYAVIRTGGKQYLVSPGEQVEDRDHRPRRTAQSSSPTSSPSAPKRASSSPSSTGAKVLASVVGEGRGDKILVFKLKRKKQYKKMQGHRQNFVEVKINEILVNGKSFKEEAARSSSRKCFEFQIQDQRKGPERPRERGNRNGT